MSKDRPAKEYKDMTIADFANMARASSDEMGSLGLGRLIDYTTGKQFDVSDEETAIFIASARSIVIELCRRLALAKEGSIDEIN